QGPSFQPIAGDIALGVRRYNVPTSYKRVVNDPASKFKVVDDGAMIGGLKTVKIEGTLFEGRSKLELWVAVEKGFLPISHKFYAIEDGKTKLMYERRLS